MSAAFPPPPETRGLSKPIWMRRWAWALAVLVVLFAIGIASGGPDTHLASGKKGGGEGDVPSPSVVVMPDVVGDEVSAARATLVDAGFTVSTSVKRTAHADPGTIVRQSVNARTTVERGRSVALVVAKALPLVPDVTGEKLASAKRTLRRGNFPVGRVTRRESRKPAGTVLAQAPSAGTSARPGRSIALMVAKSPPPVRGANNNPWGFNFACCSFIFQAQTPSAFCSYFACEGEFSTEPGYIVECADGTFGHAGGISGSCSSHGGNRRPLLRP
jgi:PASTA domain